MHKRPQCTKWGAHLYQVVFPQGSVSQADLRMEKKELP
jgi:hypothetical protein